MGMWSDELEEVGGENEGNQTAILHMISMNRLLAQLPKQSEMQKVQIYKMWSQTRRFA